MLRTTIFASFVTASLFSTGCLDDGSASTDEDTAAEGDGKADGWAVQTERKLLEETRQPAGAAQDATHVYYTLFTEQDEANNPQTTSVFRVRRSDGMREKIGSVVGFPNHLALGGGFVYVADYDGIRKIPKAGGPAQLVSDLEGATALAADAGAVYASIPSYEGTPGNETYFHRLTKIGLGAMTPVELARGTYITDIEVDDTNVFWLDETQPNPAIGCGRNAGFAHKVSKLGGADITLAAGINCPLTLEVDSTHVYWTSWAISGGVGVAKQSKLTGIAMPVAVSAGAFVQSDNANLFYIGLSGDLVRQSKTLAVPRTVAKAVNGPVIGADAAGVYFWRESQDGETRTYSLHSLGK